MSQSPLRLAAIAVLRLRIAYGVGLISARATALVGGGSALAGTALAIAAIR